VSTVIVAAEAEAAAISSTVAQTADKAAMRMNPPSPSTSKPSASLPQPTDAGRPTAGFWTTVSPPAAG
jgi:hypothetical protein